MSPAKSQMGSRSFTKALALAFNEWLLMLMLFVNSIFFYVIAKFADYSELQFPCLLCSRLDHILYKTKHLKKSHWNMVCSKHKSEISSLVYCHAHGKLVDVRGMCETCLFSFATTNKSNAETYRLLVGKLGEDSSFGSTSDRITNPRYCTCCHQMFMPQTVSTDQVAKPAMLSKIRLVNDVKTGKQSTPKKSVRFNHLPHVGYTELKIHSDTESEAVFSEDEGVVVKEEDNKFQTVDLGTPPVITLPYDLATDKLLNLEFNLHPLVAQNDREDVHSQEIGLRTNSFFPELIPVNDVSETSEKVLKKEEIISLDNLFSTSRAMEHPASVLKEKEELIHFQDVSLTTGFKEIPADALMEETELIPVNGVSETSEKLLKEKEIISLDNLFLTSRAMEHPATVLKEKEELIHFQDVSLTPDFKVIHADALMEETELIAVNGVPETLEKVLKEEEIISLDDLSLASRAMEHSAPLSKEKEGLIHLQDISVKPDFKENPANVLMEETELICLNDVCSTLVAAETSEDVLMDDTELICLSDVSSTLVAAETSVGVLMEETELICLNDVCSTLVAAETSEDVLMDDTELICLSDVSSTLVAAETSVGVLMEETELLCLNDVSSTSVAAATSKDVLMGETELICLNDVSSTLVAAETSVDVLMRESVSKEKEELILLQDASLTPEFKVNPAYALTEETELIFLKDVTSTSVSAESPEDVLRGIELLPLHDISPDEVPESLTTNETSVETSKERDTNQDVITSLESEDIVVSSTKSMPENSTKNCVLENKGVKETSLTVSSVSEMASHTEAALESESSSFNSVSVAAETNFGSGELLDLNDAYNIIVHSEGNKDSNRGAQIEQWMKKDTSRVSEDLKALLTQISASRGIEFLSPRDTSPKICSDQETKDLDHDMQMLIQKRMLERNESNLSLEGVSVSEIEGESERDRLKRQVDHDRKLLTGLYKELEEERSASAVATNQAMAMITRLQEEKSLFQMEALQNLRMMEEQAEYDMEAIQKLNDLLVEREKLIQDLEAEIDYLRDQTPQKKKLDNAENVTEIDSSSDRMSNKIQDCLTGFNEERLYITSCLQKIENRVQTDVNAHVDNLATQESVSELHERVERLKGDLYFLEHVVSSLGHGNEGVKFVKEIASHLQTLRSLSMKRQDHTES